MEYEALNEDFTNRGARVEEQIEVLRRLWTEELVTFDGEWHHLDRMGLNPMPVQRPIPIWMGAWFGKIVEKVLRRTGRLADGWMPQYPPGPELADAIARLRTYAMDAGRDPASISIACAIRVQRDEEPQKWVDAGREVPRPRRDAPPRDDRGRGLRDTDASTSPPRSGGVRRWASRGGGRRR